MSDDPMAGDEPMSEDPLAGIDPLNEDPMGADPVTGEDWDDEASEEDFIEPGAGGPPGTGIEGADDALVADEGWDEVDAPPEPDSGDPVAAAEQGNRPGDEMVSEGDDDAEIDELAGDDLDVDALSDDGIDEVDVIDGMPEVIDNADDEV